MRRRVNSMIPEWLSFNAFEIFVSILCLGSGIPLVAGQIESQSLEARLPGLLVQAWGLALVLGPLALILGIYKSWNEAQLTEYIFWERIQAWGLSALAYAAYIYAVLLLVSGGTGAILAAFFVLEFALTCHIRELTIQLRLVDIRLELGLDARRR